MTHLRFLYISTLTDINPLVHGWMCCQGESGGGPCHSIFQIAPPLLVANKIGKVTSSGIFNWLKFNEVDENALTEIVVIDKGN